MQFALPTVMDVQGTSCNLDLLNAHHPLVDMLANFSGLYALYDRMLLLTLQRRVANRRKRSNITPYIPFLATMSDVPNGLPTIASP